MSDLENRVFNWVRENSLLSSGDSVLVSFSGGPDSVALTEILCTVREHFKLNIALFHLNHGLRGEEADRDEQFCCTFAKWKDLPIFVERREVKAVRIEKKLSLEEAARSVRYTVLREVAKKWGASKVALGHTLDDQIETMLMNLIRGTGLRGLAGMRMQSDIFIRPLLPFSKREILDFLGEKGLPFVEDSSNQDVSLLRNRIRLALVPVLEEFNPHLKESLFRLSLNVQEEMARGGGNLHFPWEKEKEVSRIPLDFFFTLSPEKRLLAVRNLVEKVRGNLWDVSREHLKGIVRLVDKKRGETVLPGKLRAWVEEGYLYVSPLFIPLVKVPQWQFSVTLPGQNILPEIGLYVEGHIGEAMETKDGWKTIFDFDRLNPPFVVRNFHEGDRIYQDGKMKKVKEVFDKHGLVWEWRAKIPFLCDEEKILWIPGITLDERTRVQENSKRILSVTIRKHKG
ncbi:MAG: tRNA lysidine(34) synthetase TilS [Candidatus Caldatribacteriaceae bacterium]